MADQLIVDELDGILIGECLAEAPDDADGTHLAHTTVSISRNVGAFAANFQASLADQQDHHTKLLALLAPNMPVRPWTLMCPTVDMKEKDQYLAMWIAAQFGCGLAIADVVNENGISAVDAQKLLITAQIYIGKGATDHKKIMQAQYMALYGAVCRAIQQSQTAEKMLAARSATVHPLFEPKGSAEVQALVDTVRGKNSVLLLPAPKE